MDDPHLSQARERLGHVLKERWVLEDVLGVGGMAAVYSARHRNGARAAIKVLHGPLSEDQVVRERFLREAYLANSLDHIGTVHVLDDDADPKLGPFLVMELLDGSSLLELLDSGVTFDVPAVLDIAAQTLDVLASAHQRRIVHRDLKPANLFLCRDGQVKVLDFGIARVLDASAARLTRTGVPLGTPAYMAPEQARGLGRDADARADIYALGATLFRLLAGRHVHVGRGAEQIAQVATQRAPKLQSVAPQLPAMVCAMIDRALEFEPERRYESALAMQGDVHALQKDRPPPIASRPLADAGPVPALPPLAPRKRQQSVGPGGQPKRDEVAEIAESHRQRARELARKPDAFTVHAEGEDDEEEDENMPTLVGSPQDMIVGSRPLPLSEANAPKRKPPPGIPKPRRSPSIAGGASPERTAAAGEAAWGLAAAQAFARVPNVPVPIRPPSGQFMAQPQHTAHTAHSGASPRPMVPAPRIEDRTSDVDLDAPTLARGDVNAVMLLRIPAPPPSSLDVPPSRPVPKTQVNFQPFSPPSIPPASGQRVQPPPVEIEEQPRNRTSLVLGLLALVILAVLAGLMAAKIK